MENDVDTYGPPVFAPDYSTTSLAAKMWTNSQWVYNILYAFFSIPVQEAGFEPSTLGSLVDCSTTVLRSLSSLRAEGVSLSCKVLHFRNKCDSCSKLKLNKLRKRKKYCLSYKWSEMTARFYILTAPKNVSNLTCFEMSPGACAIKLFTVVIYGF